MKAISMAFVLLIGISAALAQSSDKQMPQKPVNWALLNLKVLDMAFDLIEDVSLQADAVDKSDEVYMPREAESGKLESKIERIATTQADHEVLSSIASYKAEIDICRVMSAPDSPTSRPANCSYSALSDLNSETNDRLKEIQKLYAATQRRKAAAPAAQ